VNQLNSVIIRINGSSPNLDHGDLGSLVFLKDAKMVGLGEATHGTKEFFQMKHRIFKYLVEVHGYKAFAFECDFAASLFFDRYITTGEIPTGVANLRELMNRKMIEGAWRTEEVEALLEWMGNYNVGKAVEDKIHFYGFDCKFLLFNADFLSEYLQGVSQELLAASDSILTKTRTLRYNVFLNMTEEEWEEIKEEFQWLYDQLVEKENEFVPLSGKKEFEIAKQLARAMNQALDITYAYVHEDYSYNYRDQYMAENALWIANLLGEHEKIALWAHNLHVSNDEDYRGKLMGKYLKEELDEGYQIIGFGFSTGTFSAEKITPENENLGVQTCYISSSPPDTSINYLFYHAAYDNFIFILSSLYPGSGLSKWLSAARPFLNIGAGYNDRPEDYYYNTILSTCYDVIIYFDETTECKVI